MDYEWAHSHQTQPYRHYECFSFTVLGLLQHKHYLAVGMQAVEHVAPALHLSIDVHIYPSLNLPYFLLKPVVAALSSLHKLQIRHLVVVFLYATPLTEAAG